eukprot:6973591-Pyramimonas_sp.AAC.1
MAWQHAQQLAANQMCAPKEEPLLGCIRPPTGKDKPDPNKAKGASNLVYRPDSMSDGVKRRSRVDSQCTSSSLHVCLLPEQELPFATFYGQLGFSTKGNLRTKNIRFVCSGGRLEHTRGSAPRCFPIFLDARRAVNTARIAAPLCGLVDGSGLGLTPGRPCSNRGSLSSLSS